MLIGTMQKYIIYKRLSRRQQRYDGYLIRIL